MTPYAPTAAAACPAKPGRHHVADARNANAHRIANNPVATRPSRGLAARARVAGFEGSRSVAQEITRRSMSTVRKLITMVPDIGPRGPGTPDPCARNFGGNSASALKLAESAWSTSRNWPVDRALLPSTRARGRRSYLYPAGEV